MALIGLAFFAAPGAVRAEPVCSETALRSLPDVRIVSVSAETDLAPHCKVAGVIGTETNFELLLPDTWNGKFVMGGGGGFVGSVVNLALIYGALQAGYATVGTDTGHQGNSLDASWALHNLERIVSFGHQAVHRTAVTAKALASAHYGRDASRNYFIGCSRGGGQALMEAQRYPQDFDGIVAGAPAYDWTDEVGARNTWINQAMYPDPHDLSRAVIGTEEGELIGKAVLDRCDSLDGLEDGILNNPLQCEVRCVIPGLSQWRDHRLPFNTRKWQRRKESTKGLVTRRVRSSRVFHPVESSVLADGPCGSLVGWIFSRILAISRRAYTPVAFRSRLPRMRILRLATA